LKKRLLQVFFYLVGISIFIYFLYASGKNLDHLIYNISFLPFSGGLLCTFGITASLSNRWGMIVNNVLGYKIAKWYEYYHYFIVSRFYGLFLPKDLTDLLVRSAYLKRVHGKSYITSSLSVIIDRAFDFFVMIMLAIASLPFWFRWYDPYLCYFFIFISIAIGFVLILLLKHTINPLSIKKFALIDKFYGKILKCYEIENFKIPSTRVVVTAYVFSLLKSIAIIIRYILIAKALNLDIPSNYFVFGIAFGQLAYMLSFTPGGIGVLEAGWYGLLSLGDIDHQTASLFVVGQRFLIILFVGICTLISVINRKYMTVNLSKYKIVI
jgi:uncharacterized protein (TIRG00374 family)